MTDELKKLEQLDTSKQITFAYLSCERLFPNYVYFSENFTFGDPLILREAIDFLSLNVFEKNPNKNKIDALLKDVEKNTPDTGDFTTNFVSSALDACATIIESLNFLIDKQFYRIKYISTSATDTVHMYIQEIEGLDFNRDKNFQNKIDNHPLMKKEVSIQSGIITFLSNSKTLNSEDIQMLLNLQGNKTKGNLNI